MITSTRADWGLLAPVASAMKVDKAFKLDILATGQHLMHDSNSLAAIKLDGHEVKYKVDMALSGEISHSTISAGMGFLIKELGDILTSVPYDAVLLLGDRYEILASALTATVFNIPIIHLCGGDVTTGAIDDSMRHALSKLATIHFPTNEQSAKRLSQLGEPLESIFMVGSTGLDRMVQVAKLSKKDFFSSINFSPKLKNFIVTFHPETRSHDTISNAKKLLIALENFSEYGIIFTGSNADFGAQEIDSYVIDYVKQRENCIFHHSLGSKRYFAALTHCDLVIGNSSSGLMEAPTFKIPTVNIGDRQNGRIRAASIIDCEPEVVKIIDAIRKGLNLDCSAVINPYGDGKSAKKIIHILRELDLNEIILGKTFRDIV